MRRTWALCSEHRNSNAQRFEMLRPRCSLPSVSLVLDVNEVIRSISCETRKCANASDYETRRWGTKGKSSKRWILGMVTRLIAITDACIEWLELGLITNWSAGGVSKEQEMEADKRALTLDVQQQHQRLILHQAFFFLDVRCVESSFPTDTDTNSIQQHSTADHHVWGAAGTWSPTPTGTAQPGWFQGEGPGKTPSALEVELSSRNLNSLRLLRSIMKHA